jgi:hypothetical protein
MRFGVNILKSFPYRGGSQHHGNTYYYESNTGGAQPPIGTLDALVDDIVAKEKTKFSSQNSFVRGRLWSQLGSKELNNMLVDKILSGSGSATTHGNLDRERAILVRFRAGIDTRGRPVYLRKYWHIDAHISGSSWSNGQLQQTAELTTGERTSIETFGNSFKSISVGTPSVLFTLVAKNGREIDGATQAHKFLEHHQLGEEWRGT